MNTEKFRVAPGEKARLHKRSTSTTEGYKSKQEAIGKLQRDIERMRKYQDVFYAADTYSLLIIFQALDAAGKDGAIKHVMSGVNPQGCKVVSFKAPGPLALDHDYLWRCNVGLPERGRIGIFNRSYYEEVLVTRVHPEILIHQKLPPESRKGNIWKRRFEEINNYEKYLHDNGTRILKFFLHLSKDEQKRRFLERIERPEKNWKLSPSDVAERAHWDDYQRAYEEAITHTSTKHAPWYVIPADHKWFARVALADIIAATLKSLKLRYPAMGEAQLARLEESKKILLAE
jgi:PPK2 family polyphosphate:nucleotide phosphotransferase